MKKNFTIKSSSPSGTNNCGTSIFSKAILRFTVILVIAFFAVTNANSQTWSFSGSTAVGRYSHTATLLQNGKVLVTGGYGSSQISSCELYDPASGTWSSAASMAESRYNHTATLLPNGKVLVAGGNSANNALISTCELYDPDTDTWSSTTSLAASRHSHTATLLPGGKVLVAGGYGVNNFLSGTCELYDPATDIWSITGSLSVSRARHTATLLTNGKALVTGGATGNGYLSSCELYDAAAGSWSSTTSMAESRNIHSATLLPDGKVLIIGGGSAGGSLSSCELYDPAAGTWNSAASMSGGRDYHTATLLASGKVLLAGGYGSSGFLSSCELYDPSSGTWSSTASMAGGRYYHTATLLANGNVLVSLGFGSSGFSSSCELYSPAVNCTVSGTWLGNSTDWFDGNNWCGGIVPTATTNVVIPAGTAHQPIAGISGGVVAAIVIAALRIENGASLTVSDGLELHVSGDMIVHGQYDGALGKLFFDGTSAQILDNSPSAGAPSSNFGDVSFNNPSSVSVGGSADVTIKKGKQYVGHVTLNRRTIAPGATGTFDVDSGSVLTVSSSGELVVGGDLTVHGQFDCIDGKLTLDGTTAQVITYDPDPASVASNFGDVSFSNPAGVTITSSPATLAIAIWLSKRGYDYYKVSSDISLSFQESFTISSGASMEVIGSREITVGGDWTNNGGTFIPNTSTLIFDGTGLSTIGGTSSKQKLGVVKVVKDLTGLGLKSVFVAIDSLEVNGITLQSGEFSAGASVISNSGDWTNNGGTFIPGTSTVSFYDGAGDSHIGGTASIQNFHKLMIRESPTLQSTGQTKRTVCSGNTTSLNAHTIEIAPDAEFAAGTASQISLDGDWIANGIFTPDTSKLTFTGSGVSNMSTICCRGHVIIMKLYDLEVAKTAGGSVTGLTSGTNTNESFGAEMHSLTLTSGTFDPGTMTDLTLSGDWTNNGGTFIPGTGKVIFNGNATSHIGGSAATETFYDMETSCTDLINDKTTLNVQNLRIVGGKFTGGPGTITLQISLTIREAGIFDPNLGTVVFNGTVKQELNDGMTSTGPRNITLHNVTVNNSSDFKIDTFTCCGVGSGRVTVTGDLTLIAGKIEISCELFIDSGGSIIGASPSRYIVTNGKGSVKRQLITLVGGPGPEMIYPIGSATGYAPVTSRLISVTGQPVVIGARVTDGVFTDYDANENPIGTAIVDRAVLKTYFATGNIPSGDQITIQPQWSVVDEGTNFDRSVCRLGHYTGGQWVYSDASVAEPGDSQGTYTGSPNITVTGLSPFGVFSQNSTACSSTGEWTGVASSSWTDTNNWCGGIVPTATTNVVIPAGTPHQPAISAGVIPGIVVGVVLGALRIDNGASLTVSDGLELHVSGDMIVHGQYDGALGKLFFDGTSAQILDNSPSAGAPSSNFGDVSFNNPSSVFVGGSADVPIKKGKQYTGHVTLNRRTIAPGATGTFDVDSASVLTVSSSGELVVGGDLTVHGQFDCIDGKLTLDGTTAQVITYDPDPASVASNFGDVSFSNPAGITITSSPSTLAIAIWAAKRGYDYYKVKSDISLRFQESFTIDTGAIMEVVGSREITVGGDWTNNGGTFIPGTSTVSFYDGAGDSHIGGTASTQNFHKLMIRESPTLQSTGQTKRTVCSGNTTSLQAHTIEIAPDAEFAAGTATQISLEGDWIADGIFTAGTSRLTFTGSGTSNIRPKCCRGHVIIMKMYDVEVAKTAGGSVTGLTSGTNTNESFGAEMHSLTLTSGTFEPGSMSDLTLSGDWTNNGGTFIPGTSNVSFYDGSGDSHISGTAVTQNFHKLMIRESPTLQSMGQTKRTVCSGNTTSLNAHTIEIAPDAEFAAGTASQISLEGDWIADGIFTAGTSRLTFTGSGTSNIRPKCCRGHVIIMKMYDVEVAKTAGGSVTGLTSGTNTNESFGAEMHSLTLTSGTFEPGSMSDLTLSGDWTNNGGAFIPGTCTVAFYDGAGDSHIGGTASTQNFHKLMIRESPTLQSTGQTKRTVCSGNTTSLNAHTIEIAPDAEFAAGTANQISLDGDWIANGIFTPDTSKLTFTGSGVSNMSTICCRGHVIIMKLYDLEVAKTAGGSVTGLTSGTNTNESFGAEMHSLTLTSGTFEPGTMTDLTLSGDWTNNGGTFTPGTGKVVFNGTIGLQHIQGTSATTFHDLSIDNTNGIVAYTDLNTDGVMDFVHGKLTLDECNFTLGENGSIQNYDQDKYFAIKFQARSKQSEVKANLKSAYTAHRTIPIGTPTNYLPVGLTLASGAPDDNFSVSVSDGVGTTYDVDNNPLGVITSHVVPFTWLVSKDLSGATDLSVKFQWSATAEAADFNRNLCNIGHYTGGAWTHYNATAASGSGPYYVECATTHFSPFTVFSQNITCSVPASPYCAGQAIAVNYVATGGVWNPGNVFTAQLSDAGGSFTSPVSIGSVTATTSGSINAIIPANTAFGTGYRIRVISSNPAGDGDNNGTNITVNAPVTPVFTQLGPYYQGSIAAALPGTSLNGVSGTWSPSAIDVASLGTTVYTFTPTAGQCANSATMSVNILVSITQIGITQDIGTTALAYWPAVNDAGVYAFQWRPLGSTGAWAGVSAPVNASNGFTGNFAKLTNLTPGLPYECRVKAYTPSGSPIAGLLTATFTPNVVTIEDDFDMGTTCKVTWPDWAPWATSYSFQYRLVGGTWSTPIPNYFPETRLSNLLPNSDYECKVTVYKGGVLWGTTQTGVIHTDAYSAIVSGTGTSRTISWTDFDAGDVTNPWVGNQAVKYRLQGATTWLTKNVTPGTFTATLTGLAITTTPYEYQIYVYLPSTLAGGFWGTTPLATFVTNGAKEMASGNVDVNIYPNPFVDQVNMDLFTPEETKVTWNMYDMTGKVVLSGNESIASGYSNLSIDAGRLSQGVYMLSATMNNERYTFRILKE